MVLAAWALAGIVAACLVILAAVALYELLFGGPL